MGRAPGERRRRGVALVLVLWILVLLGAVGAAVIGSARGASALAANARARVTARYAAESGVEATRVEVERALAGAGGDAARAADYLNGLEARPVDSVTLGDGRFAVTVLDPGARLDVNASPAGNLARLLTTVTDAGRADATAAAIRRWIDRRGVDPAGPGTPIIEPVRSLEELRAVPGVDAAALERAAPFLTVDGDGTVNIARAPREVIGAAFGEQRTSPSRLVVIARGWRAGHPLTHEIQAVFALSNGALVLVHWRERTA